MREYGTGLICLDQHISKLSDTVKGNSACHIAFQQQLPQDVYDISSIMQISEKKELFTQLPVGFAVVKLSERYTSPFLIKVPFIELRNEIIDDKTIAKRMECIVQGIEVEKDDPEFKEALIGKKKEDNVESINEVLLEIETPKIENHEIKIQVQEKKFAPLLTPKQEILYSFVLEQFEKGRSLKSIEKILEDGLSEECYTRMDLSKAINYLIKSKSNNEKKSNFHEEYLREHPLIKALSKEEKPFFIYLLENPLHKESVVEIYKRMNLSTRKGNMLKNNLLNKGLIRVEEEKNEKGWKKFIRLANNIHIH
jgi:hypothetical protein